MPLSIAILYTYPAPYAHARDNAHASAGADCVDHVTGASSSTKLTRRRQIAYIPTSAARHERDLTGNGATRVTTAVL